MTGWGSSWRNAGRIDPSYKEKSGELYQAYRAHCMQERRYVSHPQYHTVSCSSMDKAGYNRIRKNTGGASRGIKKLKEGQDFWSKKKKPFCVESN